MKCVLFSTLALALGASCVAGNSSCPAELTKEHLALVQRHASLLIDKESNWNFAATVELNEAGTAGQASMQSRISEDLRVVPVDNVCGGGIEVLRYGTVCLSISAAIQLAYSENFNLACVKACLQQRHFTTGLVSTTSKWGGYCRCCSGPKEQQDSNWEIAICKPLPSLGTNFRDGGDYSLQQHLGIMAFCPTHKQPGNQYNIHSSNTLQATARVCMDLCATSWSQGVFSWGHPGLISLQNYDPSHGIGGDYTPASCFCCNTVAFVAASHGAQTWTAWELPTMAPTMSPTAFPTPSPTASPTYSPTASPTASPTYSPTASPTVSPTDSPTAPAETPSETPTETPTEASPTPSTATAIGDPHLVNTRGEHFSIFESGNVEFIRVPYELTTEEAEFTLHANIQSFGEGDKCKEARYIAGLLFDGSWFEGKPLKVNVDVGHPGATKKEMKVSFGGVPVLPSTEPIDLGNRMFLHVHNDTKFALNVAGANFAADLQWFFLNVELSSIQKLAEKIGGLLGEDYHSAISKKPLGCDPVLLGKAPPTVYSVARVVA